MQAALQEAHEEAAQAAYSVYNTEAVGNGPVRRNYEKQLHATLKRQFEVCNGFWCLCTGVLTVMLRIPISHGYVS